MVAVPTGSLISNPVLVVSIVTGLRAVQSLFHQAWEFAVTETRAVAARRAVRMNAVVFISCG